MKKYYPLLITILLGFSSCLPAQEKQNPDYASLIRSEYPDSEPGACVLIAKNGKPAFREAFGMANLELGVAMRPDMVFEIGSMTKQFTAVAILMLLEEGKLSLTDEITRFLPDYPTHGHSITLHHLLTHTSGIRSYTGMEEWQPLWRKDLHPEELIDVFKDQPMDFAPGEKYLYNNSAYVILGYVIEKASGRSYADFLENRIFKPLKMENSCYGSHSRLVNKRAAGYSREGEGFRNAEYLSMTHPYAAGAILSNVDDLLKWQNALKNNILLREETLRKAFTGYTLNNGKPIHYGYGWMLNEIKGSPTLEHGGGIFGYTTNGIWLPDEDVYVVMLTNRDDQPPSDISTRLAALAIGKPYEGKGTGMEVPLQVLEKYTGNYEFEDGALRAITIESGNLFSQRQGSTRLLLVPESESHFAFGDSFTSIEFLPDGKGGFQAVFHNRIEKTKGHKTDKQIRERESIVLSPEEMKPFEGEYEVTPNFSLKFFLEDGQLMTQATGQPKFPVYPESSNRFFLKVVDAQLEFIRSEEGNVNEVVLYQGGAVIKAKRKAK